MMECLREKLQRLIAPRIRRKSNKEEEEINEIPSEIVDIMTQYLYSPAQYLVNLELKFLQQNVDRLQVNALSESDAQETTVFCDFCAGAVLCGFYRCHNCKQEFCPECGESGYCVSCQDYNSYSVRASTRNVSHSGCLSPYLLRPEVCNYIIKSTISSEELHLRPFNHYLSESRQRSDRIPSKINDFVSDTQDYPRIHIDKMTREKFHEIAAQKIPFVIEGLHERLNPNVWSPEAFSGQFGKEVVEVLDCSCDTSLKKMIFGDYFANFSSNGDCKPIKIKVVIVLTCF